jgi:ATP-binding cassette subfamily B (MDR/TAP) protein 8
MFKQIGLLHGVKLLQRPLALKIVAVPSVAVISLVVKRHIMPCRLLKCEGFPLERRRLILENSHYKRDLTSSEKLENLWKLIKPDISTFTAVCATAILAAIVNIYTPRAIGKLVNLISTAIRAKTISADLLRELTQPASLLLGLYFSQGFLTFLYIALNSVLGERVAYRLKTQLFDELIHKEMVFFDQVQSGELVSRLSQDISEFKHSFKGAVSQGLKSFTQVLGSLYQLMRLSSYLTSYLLVAAPVAYGFGNIYGSYLRYLSKKAKEQDSLNSSIAGECLSNIKTVKAFANEDNEVERFALSAAASQRAQEKLGFHIGLFQGTINFSIGAMVLSVLYIGGRLVINNDIDGGSLMSYLITVQQAQTALVKLSVLFAQALKASSSMTRIFEFIDVKDRLNANSSISKLSLERIGGNIELRNVTFSYPSRKDQLVLNNFSLNIPEGQVIALCGHSGSGKSTIASLIEKFYDIDAGSIQIDGYDIQNLDDKWLRRNVGFINQEPVLFAASILENIRYGNPSASFEEVIRAAKLSNAHDFIDSFPDKYNTLVGERGASLSGGQKQRIAIARALLKNPKILILDEATSALDAESERVVQDALENLMKNKTVLIIAHRLSTIEKADRIVLLGKGGVILEQGTHDELFKKRGAYYRLYTNANLE